MCILLYVYTFKQNCQSHLLQYTPHASFSVFVLREVRENSLNVSTFLLQWKNLIIKIHAAFFVVLSMQSGSTVAGIYLDKKKLNGTSYDRVSK